MAATKIQAAERPIGEIFSDAYRFTIPRYQRPYAWTTEQAGEMLDDLLTASGNLASGDADPYFLGSVVLVKKENDAAAEVIDGQQRLTTLTILLSVIRHFVSVPYAESLEVRIFQKGDPIRNTVAQPRLKLRDQDYGFFEKYVQLRDGVDALRTVRLETLTDSQTRCVENARLFLERLELLTTSDCEQLVRFMDQYTYLVAVSTQDFESAYRIFNVLNERGLDLTLTDILKSEIIGSIPDAHQDAYTKKWESEEEDLGRQDFADLFSHMRMVFAKYKARESILKEFRSSVLSKHPDGRKFIDDVLVPLSDAFEVVTRVDYTGPAEAEAINQLLGWLNQLDNTDWIPPAISYVSQSTVMPVMLHKFLISLDRLASSMFIRRVDITRRIERYGRVLEAIETGVDLYAETSPLQLDLREKVDTMLKLSADIYTVTRVRLYVLLRLDSALSSGGASYDHPLITVEHVLPQQPQADSIWRASFTEAEHAYWVHRLANLALLTRRKNSQASNYEFDVKKKGYFSASGGVSPFVLTTQILATDEWTPSVLEARQTNLLAAFSDLWDLK